MKICRGYAQVAAPGGVGSCESRHCSTVSSFHIRLSLVCPKKSKIFIGANFDFLDLSASVDVGVFDSAVLKTPLSLPPAPPWEIARPEFLSPDLGDTIRLTATGFVANDMVIVAAKWILAPGFFLLVLFVPF